MKERMKKPLVTTENYLIDALSQKNASCPINAPPPHPKCQTPPIYQPPKIK